jgi:hypothetical protein
MENLRLTSRTLEDGSPVYAVKLRAVHGDNTRSTVTLECYNEFDARRLAEVLQGTVAYAETDSVNA